MTKAGFAFGALIAIIVVLIIPNSISQMLTAMAAAGQTIP